MLKVQSVAFKPTAHSPMTRSRMPTRCVRWARAYRAAASASVPLPPLGLAPELTGILYTIPDVGAVRPGADEAGRDQGVQQLFPGPGLPVIGEGGRRDGLTRGQRFQGRQPLLDALAVGAAFLGRVLILPRPSAAGGRGFR